jgi:phosphonate metabolism protein PhnN/1,5-bisphosphokinase (PRPP-forming)
MSLLDHTPGQRQFRNEGKLRNYYRGEGAGMTDPELDTRFERRFAYQRAYAANNMRDIVALAHQYGIPLASHDDTTDENVTDAIRDGMARSIDDELRGGRTVVANVSRTVIDAVRRAYANVTVVLITAPPEILEARLAARARASDGQIGQRLGRTVNNPAAVPDFTIVNVGGADDHARELVRIINGT